MSTFHQKLAQLKNDLVTQGDRVVNHTLSGVESFFEQDREKAQAVVSGDSVIDRADVAIERACIPLLGLGETDEHLIRTVLTVVKVNNELERIADCAVNIAEDTLTEGTVAEDRTTPRTFRVMANSVIGILRDANRALAEDDTTLAQRVLTYDDAVDEFKRQIVLDAQNKVASGEMSANFAFTLQRVTQSLERIGDHCTNICEQVIYLESGLIVRHRPEGWTKPAAPEL